MKEDGTGAWRSKELRGIILNSRAKSLARLRDDARARAERIAELLKGEYGVSRVILYGSLAEGGFHEGSDIDLLVEGFNGPFWQMYAQADRLAGGFRLSVVCRENADASLLEHVEKRGVVL